MKGKKTVEMVAHYLSLGSVTRPASHCISGLIDTSFVVQYHSLTKFNSLFENITSTIPWVITYIVIIPSSK